MKTCTKVDEKKNKIYTLKSVENGKDTKIEVKWADRLNPDVISTVPGYKRWVIDTDTYAHRKELEENGEDEELEIYTSGAKNIFRYPELADNQKASEIIDTFEEKQMLSSLVKETLTNSDSRGIQVYIGEESPVSAIRDCSVVTATYELGEGMRGTIGIIGPKRMDYEKVVDSLKGLMHQLDNLYDKKE